MANRAGVVCALACATGLWLGLQATVALRAQQVARVIQVAELPDVGLGEFYNGLFRFPIDHIVDDHGVRFGSIGSDIFHDPVDSVQRVLGSHRSRPER